MKNALQRDDWAISQKRAKPENLKTGKEKGKQVNKKPGPPAWQKGRGDNKPFGKHLPGETSERSKKREDAVRKKKRATRGRASQQKNTEKVEAKKSSFLSREA